MDKDYRVLNYPPQYLAAQVITKESVQPVDAPHRMFRATSDVTDDSGNVLVAYALERPDGQWSIMLINKDHDSDRAVTSPTAGQNPLAILPERWTASALVQVNTSGMGMRVDRATPIRTARRQNQR